MIGEYPKTAAAGCRDFHMSRKRYLNLFLILMMVALLAHAPAALAEDPPAPPAIGARSALLINADNGQVLFSQNPDERLPMASTTKMMTALIIAEETSDMNALVTTSQRAAEVGESSIWLTAGEQLSVHEMLMGMLIQSGNDAATALAEYNAGSVEAFVEKMNGRAAELGMTGTHFTNPHGLDEPGHYTTASDFIILARQFSRHPELLEIVKCPDATIPKAGEPAGRLLINHNHLLDIYPVINGIKTGYTDAAGQCIIISASNNGVNLLLAYLGADSLARRNEEVIALVDYGFGLYHEETVIEQGGEYAYVGIPYNRDGQLRLVAQEGMTGQVFYSHSVDHRTIVPEEVVLPVRKGDKVGLVSAYEGDTFLGSTYLVATEDIPEVSWTGKIGFYLESVFGFLSVTSIGFLREVLAA